MGSDDKLGVLYTLGEARHGGKWLSYADYGLSEADVPGLLALVADESLHEADIESNDVWVPLHAWRALGQIGSAKAVQPLLALFDRLREDDWAQEELPRVMGMIGEAAIEPLSAYMNDGSHDEFARVMAADGLKEIAVKHPACRSRVVETLSGYLAQPDEKVTTMNGLVVCCLLDLDAKEAIDSIRWLYDEGCVDISCAGDLEDVEIALGLRLERETPKPNYGAFHQVRQHASWTDDEDGSAIKTLYDEVDELLLQYGSDTGIQDISELDGFFSAVVCAPNFILPSLWMPAIWGGHKHIPDWPDEKTAHAFVSAAMVIHNQVAKSFDEEMFQALFLEQEIEGKRHMVVDAWCEGFMRGLSLWDPLSDTDLEFMGDHLRSVYLFATEEGAKELEVMDEEEIEHWQQKIEVGVAQVHQHFSGRRATRAQPIRVEKTVGRNDPCPCGSGKKFKKCCLH